MMDTLWEDFRLFISTNDQPEQNKILVSLLTVLIFALAIFLLSALINNLRNVNLLKLPNYRPWIAFKWIMGAVLLDFILLATKITNYNIVSFLVIAMVWDNIYQKLFNQAKEKEIATLDSIDAQ